MVCIGKLRFSSILLESSSLSSDQYTTMDLLTQAPRQGKTYFIACNNPFFQFILTLTFKLIKECCGGITLVESQVCMRGRSLNYYFSQRGQFIYPALLLRFRDSFQRSRQNEPMACLQDFMLIIYFIRFQFCRFMGPIVSIYSFMQSATFQSGTSLRQAYAPLNEQYNSFLQSRATSSLDDQSLRIFIFLSSPLRKKQSVASLKQSNEFQFNAIKNNCLSPWSAFSLLYITSALLLKLKWQLLQLISFDLPLSLPSSSIFPQNKSTSAVSIFFDLTYVPDGITEGGLITFSVTGARCQSSAIKIRLSSGNSFSLQISFLISSVNSTLVASSTL